jgi:hypothetical protein
VGCWQESSNAVVFSKGARTPQIQLVIMGKVSHLVSPSQPSSQPSKTSLVVCKFVPNGLKAGSVDFVDAEVTSFGSIGGSRPGFVRGAMQKALAIFKGSFYPSLSFESSAFGSSGLCGRIVLLVLNGKDPLCMLWQGWIWLWWGE